FEQCTDRMSVLVDEAPVASGPADVFDEYVPRVDAGLQRGVAKILHVAEILFAVFHAGEVQRAAESIPDFGPARNQLLVQGVELIAGRESWWLPVPLRDSGLDGRGGSVRVKLEEFGRMHAVVT